MRVAQLTEAPREVQGVDGTTRWRAKAQDVLTGYPYDAQISLKAGEWYPFRKGDLVLIALPFGSTQGAEIVGHKGLPGDQPNDPDNTELVARMKADGETRASLRMLAPGGRVDLGEGDPDDQERVAMHPKVAAELRALWAGLDALTDVVAALQYIPGTLATAPVLGAQVARETVDAAMGGESIDGGKAATNVYAKPED